MVQPPWKTVWQVYKGLNSEIPFLFIHPKEMKTYTCIHMFTAALCIIVKKGEKNSKVNQPNKGQIKMYTQIIQDCMVRWNGIPIYAWVSLEDIILKERRHTLYNYVCIEYPVLLKSMRQR